jgi:putative nucleotidyltransferase with HDIG domain
MKGTGSSMTSSSAEAVTGVSDSSDYGSPGPLLLPGEHVPPQPPLSETAADEITVKHPAEDREDVALRAHCLRVATWASELAGAIGLSESERKLVEQAAMAHHFPEVLVDDQARAKLLEEIHMEATGEEAVLSDSVRIVLETLWGRRPIADPAMGKIVAVLEISDDFDQYFESQPLFDDTDTPDECANSSVEAMMSYLQVTSRADVNRVIDRLPVFPRAAREVVRQVTNPEVGPRELAAVCSLDPVLAGRVIQIANSAFYSPRLPIGTIVHAVSFIGTETTRRVLLAAALRGNFASPDSHLVWNHSLDVAQTAEMLARHGSVKVDPAQAFLAGLVHDIGRLAFSIMPAAFIERFHRLTDGGCPPVEVEMCLSGRCHGEVGSETLAQWKFPDEIVEAIRWHHRPERSDLALASVLYLAEFITDSQEDLPSYIRLKTACQRAGITMTDLTNLRHQDSGGLENLRFAA